MPKFGVNVQTVKFALHEQSVYEYAAQNPGNEDCIRAEYKNCFRASGNRSELAVNGSVHTSWYLCSTQKPLNQKKILDLTANSRASGGVILLTPPFWF